MKHIAAKHRPAPALNGITSGGKASNGDAASARPTPRPGPVRPRGSIVAAIDIGTTKICCFIARVENEPRVLGLGQQIARGVRGGTIIDLEAASASISSAVHAAEQMAGHQIDRAVVNLSGGYRASRLVKTEIAVGRREIRDADMRQVLAWTLLFTIIMLLIELLILKPIERRIFAWRPQVAV